MATVSGDAEQSVSDGDCDGGQVTAVTVTASHPSLLFIGQDGRPPLNKTPVAYHLAYLMAIQLMLLSVACGSIPSPSY